MKVWVLEFVQNYPSILGFTLAAAAVKAQMVPVAFLTVFAGSVTSALVIRYTEPAIVDLPVESWRQSLTNALAFTVISTLILVLLHLKNPAVLQDALVGLLAGIAISFAQGMTSGEKPSLNHTLALGLGTAVGLPLIRWLESSFHPFTSALILCLIFTWIVVVVDYRPKSSS